MPIDRTAEPSLMVPEKIIVRQAEKIELANGFPIYVINAGTEDVIRCEVILPSWITGNENYTCGLATHQLSDTGTHSKNAQQIAETFDQFGSFFQSEISPDFKTFTVYSLNRNFEESLRMMYEVMTGPVFPEEEISVWKKRNLQSLAINRQKVSWLAKTGFQETLFGKNHKYGFHPEEENINSVNHNQLISFHTNYYHYQRALVVLSGRVTDLSVGHVEKRFGNLMTGMSNTSLPQTPPPSAVLPKNIVRIPVKDAIQSGIRMGKKIIGKSHPDYLPMFIVNTLLGGYFGSRLMSNIREDKGYTYGIGSGLHSFLEDGMFFIATEVGKDVCGHALEEIHYELNRLRSEPVPQKELDLVRNYLTGSLLRSMDGPFALADRFKSIKLHGMDYDYFDKYMHILNNITPLKISELAVKYLDPEEMVTVIAG
jgi:zinc protease